MGDAMDEDAPRVSDDERSEDEDRRPGGRRNLEKSKSRSRSRSREREPEKRRPPSDDKPRAASGNTDTMTIGDEDAAFLLGAGGSTKRKVARAAGARLDLDDDKETRGRHVLTVSGSDAARARAMDYVRWVLRQRLGAIEVSDASKRDDLSVVRVPADCVAYVTGKSGRVLRSVEEEFGTLMFFGKLVGEEPNGGGARNDETLCVLGDRRGRRGAELKVMSAVEHKTPGVFVNDQAKLRERLKQPGDGLGDGFGYDVFPFEEHEFSYALGAQGSTRKKLAAASGALLEYVGRAAVMAGTRAERSRCWDYLTWLLKQRKGSKVFVDDPEKRDDCTELRIPRGAAGRVQGKAGETLRSIERETKTFCFLVPDRDDPDGKEELVLIFGADKKRRYKALDLMEDAMSGRYRARDGDRGGRRDERRRDGSRDSRGRDRDRDRDRDRSRSRERGRGGPDRGGLRRDDRRDDRPYANGRRRDRSRDRGRDRSRSPPPRRSSPPPPKLDDRYR